MLFARDAMMADIRNDLEEFGVRFDRWYSERELNQSGAIDRALAELRKSGRVYTKDGAEWFKSTEFGDDEDRVVVRANGEKTYFASDIAYHFDKLQRGHELLIDVWGADHHGYVARVRGALVALGRPADSFEVCLMQLVSLFRGGEKLAMGKREGNFVTLRELRNEVGNDACRFFYLLRSHDQALDFDLELAKSRSNENPVYYIQYAHARVSSVMKQLGSKGFTYEAAAADLALLEQFARADGDHRAVEVSGNGRTRRTQPRAACAGALPARSCQHTAHLLQRGAVHRRGCRPAQCPPHARARRAAGDPQWSRNSRRLRARDDVGVGSGRENHQPGLQALPQRRHTLRVLAFSRIRLWPGGRACRFR